MFCDFQTRTYGKWILAGEHAVVRGHEALVFPIKGKYLNLNFCANAQTLGADYTGISGADMHLLFWSVLEQGTQLLGTSLNHLRGHFYIDSTIPVGVGMGASASLCVAMSRWFCAQGMIAEERISEFARELEHLFHGKSSGLDIAGVSSDTGICFKEGVCAPLKAIISPLWYLSSCNQIGMTSHCIQQVQSLWEKDACFAQHIDQQMLESVQDSRKALEQGGTDAIENLARAINKAAHCFMQWGLVSESLQQHMSKMRSAGAIAVKPTGSGGGGYVLSLWNKQPPQMDIELIQG